MLWQNKKLKSPDKSGDFGNRKKYLMKNVRIAVTN